MAFAGSKELVASAEAKLGRRLPDVHRARLIRENGGEIIRAGALDALPGLGSIEPQDHGPNRQPHRPGERVLRREWPNALPDGFLALADNGGGNPLVLPQGDDEVRFPDHETGQSSPVKVRWE